MMHENDLLQPACPAPAYSASEDAADYLKVAKNLRGQQRYREAAEAYQRIVERSPFDLQAHFGVGAMLQEAGDLAGANAAYVHILQWKPDCAEAWTNLGVVCQDLGDLALAADMHRQAIALAPAMAEAHNNLGSVLSRRGDLEGALTCFHQTLMLEPDHAGAHYNIGHVYQQRGNIEFAEECYRRALACQPQSDTFRFYLSQLELLQGRFAAGWTEYESRWGTRALFGSKRHFLQPRWRGEPLQDEAILLYAEQGFGDTLQFVRYVPWVAARGGRVILEVQPELFRLLAGMEGVAELVSRGAPLPLFAWQCPLMSLPLAFETELASIPCSVPYLSPGGADMRAWSQRLSGDGLKIGLAWGGNPKHPRDHMRTIPLAELAPLTAVAGTRYYSLQKGPASAQMGSLPPGMALSDLESKLTDFADTAAAIANLDLIITSDTSVAHLAGALAKPVWILLHNMADWRWLLHREDSPWYPTARLFRKLPGEGWPVVVRRIREEIERLARGQPAGK